MEIPGATPGFFAIFGSMKHIEVITSTTEKYVCDVCRKELSGEYELANTTGAGNTFDDGVSVSYGYNINVGNGFARVEHVCKDCMRKVLKAILERL